MTILEYQKRNDLVNCRAFHLINKDVHQISRTVLSTVFFLKVIHSFLRVKTLFFLILLAIIL